MPVELRPPRSTSRDEDTRRLVEALRGAEPPARRRRAGVLGGRWRMAALVVVVSAIAGGVSGGIVAHVTEPDSKPVPSQPSAPPVGADTPAILTVLAEVEASVVRIDVASQARIGPFGASAAVQSSGTGFVIGSDGVIATAAHVVSGAEEVTVLLADGSKAAAAVIGADKDADLAVLRIDQDGLVPLAFGTSDDLVVGELVLAVGHALALEGAPTVSMGILSAVDRTITISTGETYDHLLQTDAAINAGDSGGPLIDMAGKVIGINTAKVSTDIAENMGFAIAVDEALPVLEALQARSG